ncbi:DNA repair protein RAD52 homolog, partial [Aphidius gifuensis]
MSFTSCIKIPATKMDTSPEKNNTNAHENDKASVVYHQLISIANDIFGDGNWSHAVTSQTIDFVEYVMGKYHIGCAAFVKVQLNVTFESVESFHEDMGYSNAENSVKGLAIKSAREASINNALKKVLICFGKEFEYKISKIYDNQKPKIQNSAISTLENGRIIDKPFSRTKSAPLKTIEKPEKMDIAVTIDPVMKKDIPDKKIPSTIVTSNNQVVSTSNDNLTTAPISEEELQRLERKRRQKQKQEEYKRQMLEKTNNEK